MSLFTTQELVSIYYQNAVKPTWEVKGFILIAKRSETKPGIEEPYCYSRGGPKPNQDTENSHSKTKTHQKPPQNRKIRIFSRHIGSTFPALTRGEEDTFFFIKFKSTQMASAWRVISFFLVVFVLPTVLISLPLYARYHLYHTRHMPMTETDTRALNYAVSSFWCQGQRVSSNGTLDAYLVSGTPRLREERRHVTLKRMLTLKHDGIEYWGVYLLKGSTFTVASTARWPGGVLLVAKGEDNLRKCFYREDKLEAELNGSPPKTVYRSPPDVDDLPGEMLVEEEHHGDTGGGEVFDDDEEEEEDLPLTNLGTKQQEEAEEGSEEMPKVEVIPRPTYGLKNKSSEAPKRRNGKNKKGKKGKKNRRNKNETHHRRSRRSEAVASSSSLPPVSSSPTSSPPPALPSLSPGTLDMLHRFNDTLEVTTGNSSFSSSEEFLEQCQDSILVVDLQPSLDWEWRLNTDNIRAMNSWTVPVDSSDYYYFIFTSDNSIELNHLGFRLDLHRSTYDISSPLEACRNASECIFPLAFTQTESVVVEVPAGEQLDELHSFEVTTACQPRVPVYMVFILLVPFIILLFAFQ